MQTKQVYSLTVCGRATIDMHSLNNEGAEGNQIATRMVNIVDQNGKLAVVNAISGDMLKHIQAEHLFRLAKSGKLALCKGCKHFSANRILEDADFIKLVKEKKTNDSDLIDTLLKTCVIDDIEGILIAVTGKATPRKSIVEFGWVVGVPEITKTDTYLHVKYVPDSGQKPAAGESDVNVGQNLFHRPASSGIYAVVVSVEVSRLGFNDLTQVYALSDDERSKRHKVLMESLLCTFVEPNGAMRSAQNPHMVNFEGAICLSTQVLPAPTISPLNEQYRDEIRRVVDALNKIKSNAIEVFPFESLGGFADIMAELTQTTTPFKWHS